MKKIGRFIFHLFLMFLVLTGLGVGGYYGFQWLEQRQMLKERPKLVTAKDRTNTSAAWHNLANYQKALRGKYSFINKVSNYVPPRTWDGKDAVIPGLISTKSYDFKAKKYNTATAMTPQGIAVADKYILLTAYDGDHQHASVIYVLNKKTGKYIKTIQVAGRPHLGGIAYDPVAKNIWVTGSLGKSSALASFSLKKLQQYDEAKHLPIKYNHQIAISAVEKASTVTYYDGQLFVGFFNMYGRGKVAAYTIARSGKNKDSITNNEVKSVTGTLQWSDPTGETSMDKQIQGIAIYQDKIFLSQSYGSGDSKLYVFPTSALNALDEKNAELVIDMPPYLEQITAYKGQLLCVFESASRIYAKPHIVVMDRILSMNINALFGN
ncbi:YncE family protein [Lactobacillus kefiranofaciens]|uniref:Lipoprotein n=1 Tax=Lactobacillus kefiranofaciens TaxID=267818 RepID=A0AAX3UCB9_9LACO|nr:hypothetical protein [Lactobacillus kefiranofaciens]AEG41279.1 Hypothetical protein WANG_1584 [Lactobacillus kefiranofaciens subsp. kefiranofaciens]MCJ2172926.1 hypothetical protein [Lactobacillus kefiranofaciens]MCP9330631.1 hypothetical protein [Lactobacillus kefiranofaciens]PAK97491.1 hypothetical protein B8W86_09810 [Lactobacillus kefiranofaciens]QFQ68794.1 hypothetical protein LKK75_10905 [Lactobacillus kefiranofaciens subsp. kefiranofaciens]